MRLYDFNNILHRLQINKEVTHEETMLMMQKEKTVQGNE
jgi:hypothetical protein